MKELKRLTEQTNRKKTRRQLDFSSEEEPSYTVPYIDTNDDMNLEDDDHCCILYGEGKTELWYQCVKWAHAAYTRWE